MNIFRNLLIKLTKSLINFLVLIIYPIDRKFITFWFRGFSGSNISPILEKIQNGYLNGYKIKVINISEERRNVLEKIKYYWYIAKWKSMSKIMITTHGEKKLRKKTIHVELWHGFPLKSMALMDLKARKSTVFPDIVCSNSYFYNTIMNACLGLPISRYILTGFPRNDYLYFENGKDYLEILLNTSLGKYKIIFYAPTFRIYKRTSCTKDLITDGNKSWDNIFGFKKFDMERFEKFLEKNDLFFLVKLHPFEEEAFKNKIRQSNRVKLISQEILKKRKIDLYKILNAIDILITDYSSIYFDFLLLNRPIIFTPVDLEKYRKTRGLLLEPYELWTPGPKCISQDQLELEIERSLQDKTYYSEERKRLCKIVHHFTDGKSTERVLQLIENLIKEG